MLSLITHSLHTSDIDEVDRDISIPASVATTQSISSSKLSPTNTTTGFEITTPGYYYLSSNIIYTPTASFTIPAILINTDNVVLDLATKNISLGSSVTTVGNQAIQIAAGKKNITIKNGSISGFSPSSTTGALYATGNNTNIVVENIAINNCCASLGTTTATGSPLYINNSGGSSKGITLRNVQCVNNASTTSSMTVANIIGASYVGMFDCAFSNNSTTGQVGVGGLMYGLQLNGCSDVVAVNLDVSNNTTSFVGTGATATTQAATYGIRLSTSTKNCRLSNCRATGNSSTGTAPATPSWSLAYGISLNACTGNTFTDCIATGQTSTGVCYGIGVESSSNTNIFINCQANENTSSSNQTGGNTYGVYVSSSRSNQFLNCQANNNASSVAAGASALYYDATGFYSTAGTTNAFIGCTATGNGSGGFHTGYGTPPSPGTTTSYSCGFRLDTGERATVIRECTARANNPTNTAMGATNGIAAGILLTNTCNGCVVDSNLIVDNQSLNNSNADTGRSIGYWDMTLNSSTFLKKNISVGQGSVYNHGTSLTNPTTGVSVNYYLTFTGTTGAGGATPNFNPENIIKETDISNLNALALAGGEAVFNWSIVNVVS